MNKYLEKIARASRIGGYARRKFQETDFVEVAIDTKGKVEDVNSIHSKYQEHKKRKKK